MPEPNVMASSRSRIIREKGYRDLTVLTMPLHPDPSSPEHTLRLIYIGSSQLVGRGLKMGNRSDRVTDSWGKTLVNQNNNIMCIVT